MASDDEFFMRGALSLARRALGRAWPNPAVGALIVRPDGPCEIIARGWTGRGGRPHAEQVAIQHAAERAKGATLYVTLEPCAHHGKTPPCTNAVIAAGIRRVVCSVGDPDPRTTGAGFARLRQAGIDVSEGILAGAGARIAQGHILRVTRNRPLVQLKLAVGSDGKISPGDGKPVWVTGEDARNHGHLLRARADAILVGRGTVQADDPALTCRLPGMLGASPVKVVLDTHLKLEPQQYRIFNHADAPCWVVAGAQVNPTRAKTYAGTEIEILRCATEGADWMPVEAVLRSLAERGITRLLVEGGPTVSSSFWRAGVVDEIYIYQGTRTAGPKALDALSGMGLHEITDSPDYAVSETRILGSDRLTIYCRSGH